MPTTLTDTELLTIYLTATPGALAWPQGVGLRAVYEAGAALPGPFALGDVVQKVGGAGWRGRIVGTYSTTLTPVGYAVESDAPGHEGSVQIYPARALRKVTL